MRNYFNEKIDLKLGDCMKIMPMLLDNSVDFTLTDIPYDEVNRKDNGLRNLNKGSADILTFDLEEFLKSVYRVTKIVFAFFAVKSNSVLFANTLQARKELSVRLYGKRATQVQ